MPTPITFLAIGIAASADEERFSIGEKHAFLACVRADSYEEADAKVIQEMESSGWGAVRTRQIGIGDPAKVGEKALEEVQANGFLAIIYPKVEE
ncbi:MAG TPA: hypothetical protein VFO76_10530 [Candidatus Kapabacteria bacterium]|nr:hypothetical protein [Candidatus Kapabacteria bacterium]